jgi:hypothetical protein
MPPQKSYDNKPKLKIISSRKDVLRHCESAAEYDWFLMVAYFLSKFRWKGALVDLKEPLE